MKPRTLAVNGMAHAALLLFMLFLVFPLIWMLSTSFKPTAEIYSGAASLVPQSPSAVHYRTVLSEQSILSSMVNSLYVGIFSTAIAILIALPGAYALTRYTSK